MADVPANPVVAGAVPFGNEAGERSASAKPASAGSGGSDRGSCANALGGAMLHELIRMSR
jgi:hypothetical protein